MTYDWRALQELPAQSASNQQPKAGRWHVTLSTRDGDITITAPNAISTEAMREAMRAYWGEKT